MAGTTPPVVNTLQGEGGEGLSEQGGGLSGYQDLDWALDARGCPLDALLNQGGETFGIGPRGVGADLSQVLMIGHNTKQCIMMFCLHAIVGPVFGFLFDCKLKVSDFDEI